ncbi:MAG: type 1 glutamine amidotransferase domain-containing protein [Propionibacteriaceae bacterium]
MSTELTGKTFAFLCANTGVEQVELTEPWRRVTEAGGTPVLVAPEGGRVQAFEGDVNKADTFEVDRTLEQASVEDFDGLVLPGGTTNPDQLRLQPEAVEFVRGFVAADKPVGAICHGPWMLVEADVVQGKTLTSWPSLRTDIRNAGGTWVDEQVFTCGARGWALVTSRKPDDLDAFCQALLDTFGQG